MLLFPVRTNKSLWLVIISLISIGIIKPGPHTKAQTVSLSHDWKTIQSVVTDLTREGWELDTELPTIPPGKDGKSASVFGEDGKRIVNDVQIKHRWVLLSTIKHREYKAQDKSRETKVLYNLIQSELKEVKISFPSKNKYSANVTDDPTKEDPTIPTNYSITVSIPPKTMLRVVLIEHAIEYRERNGKAHLWYTGTYSPVIFFKKKTGIR